MDLALRTRVETIFGLVLHAAPAERESVLDEACGGDVSLRREVALLLAEREALGGSLQPPASASNPEENRLRPGTVVGHYRILRQIGSGGMGTVYEAEDTKLHRRVALKFLPEKYAKDAQWMLRFRVEARAAAALNHPNICTIYDVDDVGGQLFIAMEMLDGQTLGDLIQGNPVPVHTIVDLGVQIAAAVNAAHAKGVVHRDLKPANIFVTTHGQVKILDFGVAKLTTMPQNVREHSALRTQVGMVVGSIGYLAPEQLRGESLDSRSDIFSIGCVLYEMATGSRAFDKPSLAETMACILVSDPPPMLQLSPAVPAELQSIVARCLEKDPARRFQSATDLALALRNLATPSQLRIASWPGEIAAYLPVRRRVWSSPWTIAALVLLLGAAGLAFYLGFRHSAPTPDEASLTQVTSSDGLDVYPSLSPDGSAIAYSSDQNGTFEIFVKSLASGGRDMQLTSDGQDNIEPAWSPDGRYIAYFARKRGGIWIIPALGGAAHRLTDFGSRPAWSPDSTRIAFQSMALDDIGMSLNALPPSTLWIVSAAGGAPTQLTKPGIPAGGHGAPSWSHDGKRIVFGSDDLTHGEAWSISPQGGKPQHLLRGAVLDPVYAPDGHSLYFSQKMPAGNSFKLMRLALAPDGKPVGAPQVIKDTDRVAYLHLNFSADGKFMAYSQDSSENNLWSLPISVRTADATGPPGPLTRDTNRRKTAPIFSPDGRTLSYTLLKFGPGDGIALIDADGKNSRSIDLPASAGIYSPGWLGGGAIVFIAGSRVIAQQIDSGKTTDLGPAADGGAAGLRLSPDGTQMAFTRTRNGVTNVWLAPTAGGPARQLTFDKEGMDLPEWSPDGRFLALQMKRGDDSFIAIVPAGGGPPIQLNGDPGQSWGYGWSPDGDKISFAGERNGIWNLYWISRVTRTEHQLTHYTSPSVYVRYPAWSPRGDQIVYEYARTTGNIWLMRLK